MGEEVDPQLGLLDHNRSSTTTRSTARPRGYSQVNIELDSFNHEETGQTQRKTPLEETDGPEMVVTSPSITVTLTPSPGAPIVIVGADIGNQRTFRFWGPPLGLQVLLLRLLRWPPLLELPPRLPLYPVTLIPASNLARP